MGIGNQKSVWVSLQVQSQFEKPLLCICACAAYDMAAISERVFFESANKCQPIIIIAGSIWGWGFSGAGVPEVHVFGYATSEANINSAGLPAQVQFNQEGIMLAEALSPLSLGSVPPTAVLPQVPPPAAPATTASSLERLAF